MTRTWFDLINLIPLTLALGFHVRPSKTPKSKPWYPTIATVHRKDCKVEQQNLFAFWRTSSQRIFNRIDVTSHNWNSLVNGYTSYWLSKTDPKLLAFMVVTTKRKWKTSFHSGAKDCKFLKVKRRFIAHCRGVLYPDRVCACVTGNHQSLSVLSFQTCRLIVKSVRFPTRSGF